MRKYFALFFVAFAICGSVHAQYRGVFLEIGGSGGLGSLNYEKSFWPRTGQHAATETITGTPSNLLITWRAGISTTPIDKNNGWVMIFPVMLNGIYGAGKHKLEVGIGLAPSITTKGSWYIKSPAMIGYRFSIPDKKMFYRITYTPIIGWLVDYQWQHWAGVSIGYKLG